MSPQSNNNNFFGIKVSKPGINVNQASPSQLIYQNDYSAETFFGTKGNISFGQNKDGSQGMQVVDESGFLLFELNGETWYWYDKVNNVNVMQIGLLPDGTYGMVIAKPGYDVNSLFT